MRIGVAQGPFESFTPENDHEPVAFARLDDDFSITELLDFGRQQGAKRLAYFRIDAAGPAVSNNAFVVQRAKIGAGGNVARLQGQPEPERLDHPATDLKFQRV